MVDSGGRWGGFVRHGAGWISATVAVVGLVITLSVTKPWASGAPASSGQAVVPPATAGSAAAQPARATPATANEPSPGSPAVLASTVLRVTDTYFSVDVGRLPLAAVQEVDGSFWYYEGKLLPGTGAGIAAWTAAGEPDASHCADLLRSQPASELVDRKGLRFCVYAYDPKRVASGQVLSYNGSVSQIRVTVWDELLS